MVSRAQRRRGAWGFSPSYAHLPWPSDVTEEQKAQWEAEWNELVRKEALDSKHGVAFMQAVGQAATSLINETRGRLVPTKIIIETMSENGARIAVTRSVEFEDGGSEDEE